MATAVAFSTFMGLFWATVVANFIWVTLLVYGLRWNGFQAGVLAVFGGFTIFLAIYFTNSIPKVGLLANPYWVVALAFLWDIVTGFFGHFLGWFTLFLTFPHKVTK